MSKQTMSEIIAAYNALAAEQGKDEVTSFKNLAAARAALKSLESKPTMTTEVQDVEVNETIPESNNAGPKYNSAAKRGPAQGIGAFCKGLIAEGKTNAEILGAIAEQFPAAKTTANCVAYYRAKMKLATKVVTEEVAEEVAA